MLFIFVILPSKIKLINHIDSSSIYFWKYIWKIYLKTGRNFKCPMILFSFSKLRKETSSVWRRTLIFSFSYQTSALEIVEQFQHDHDSFIYYTSLLLGSLKFLIMELVTFLKIMWCLFLCPLLNEFERIKIYFSKRNIYLYYTYISIISSYFT